MPIESIRLKAGINADFTPTLNEGGWSRSNLIRWKGGLPQKLGGWTKFWNASIGSAVRALHAWRDINAIDHLAVGAQGTLGVITSSALADITPQTIASNFVPYITTTSGSKTVTINDPNISNVTTFDSIFFETPITVGGLTLVGSYAISLVTGTSSYEITSAKAATATVGRGTITGATKANPCVITANAHGFTNGQLVYIAGVGGMTQINGKIFTVANAAANTFELSGINSTAYTTYTSGGYVYGGIVPQFASTSGSANVVVTIVGHGLSVGDSVTFPIATTVSDVTLDGTYTVVTVPSVDTLTVTASASAAATASATMNAGLARLTYFINLGPPAVGAGFGIGTYGTGTYGTGVVPSAQVGTKITATDWSLDNWGKTIVACPDGGGIYTWDPDGGFSNAKLVTGQNAPVFNTGIFVAQPAQILVAYGSTTSGLSGLGVYQDPLLIRWSDQDDYEDWTVDTTDQAGSQRIPRGSRIVSGMQGPNQALIWTDIALWSMQYVGQPLVFSTNEIATGCGLIAKHARCVLGGTVFWMGEANFWMLSGRVSPVPCTVWNIVYDDLDPAYSSKCWAWANSLHNEVWFFYPSKTDATGECSRYVKVTVPTAGESFVWDYGTLARSSGIDQSVVGDPISATTTGLIYQHETANDADGSPMNAWVESGDLMISEGAVAAFVDRWWPDMKWGPYNSSDAAQVAVTFTCFNDMSGQQYTDGPHTLTNAVNFVIPRFRAHRVRIKIESTLAGPAWRLGRNRYRVAPDGRR